MQQGTLMKGLSDKLSQTFTPIILKAIQQVQEEKENSDGCWQYEMYKKMHSDLKALSSKGIPRTLSDYQFQLLIFSNKILFNSDYTKFSLIPLEGYRSWDEQMKLLFKGYTFTDKLELEIVDAPTLNYNMICKILLNKDQEQLIEETQQFEQLVHGHQSLFLDSKCKPVSIFAVSMMRSGNTMIRQLLESITGVTTGSNYNKYFNANANLFIIGQKGESIVDERVWFHKDHFPYIYQACGVPHKASKALVLVRNPLDVLVSLFQMSLTLTQTKSCSNDFPVEFKEEWTWFVQRFSQIWAQYQNYWFTVQQKQQIPVYFVRYEDLVLNQEETMMDAFKFVMGEESLSGTYLEKRIKSICNQKNSSLLYNPRSGKLHANQKYFSEGMLNYIKKICKQFILHFGYAQIPEVENLTAYFEYDSLTTEDKESYYSFVDCNKQNLKWYLENKDDLDKLEMEISKDGEGIKFLKNEEPCFRFNDIREKIKID